MLTPPGPRLDNAVSGAITAATSVVRGPGRECRLAASHLADGGPPGRPGADALERRGRAQDRRVVVATPHDLKPDGQAVPGEPARHRRRRLARAVEREREGDPGVRGHRLAGDLGRVVEPHLERRPGDRWRQPPVVLLAESPGGRPPGPPV